MNTQKIHFSRVPTKSVFIWLLALLGLAAFAWVVLYPNEAEATVDHQLGDNCPLEPISVGYDYYVPSPTDPLDLEIDGDGILLSAYVDLQSEEGSSDESYVRKDSVGTYPATTTVNSDRGGHETFVQLGTAHSLNVNIAGGTISVAEANPPSQWVDVAGDIGTDGVFSATGTGTVAGFTNVAVELAGSIDSDGLMTALYTMGTKKELFGVPIIFDFLLTIPDSKTHTVTNATDEDDGTCDGNCSLREALNASGPGHTVLFDIPGAGPHSIALTSLLDFSQIPLAPVEGTVGELVTDTLNIKGLSQPGSSANTNAVGLDSNAVRNIIVEAATPSIASAMSLSPEWIVWIEGLAFEGFENALELNNPGVTVLNEVGLNGSGVNGTTTADFAIINSELENANVAVTATAADTGKVKLMLNGNVGTNAKFSFDSDGQGQVDVDLTDEKFTLGADYEGAAVDLTLGAGGTVNINNLDVTGPGAQATATAGINITAGSALLDNPIKLDVRLNASTLAGLGQGITATAQANVTGTWATKGNYVTKNGFGAAWAFNGNVSYDSENDTLEDNSNGGLLVNYNTKIGEDIELTLNASSLLTNGVYNGRFESQGEGVVTWNIANSQISGGKDDGLVFSASLRAAYRAILNDLNVANNVDIGLTFELADLTESTSVVIDVSGTDICGSDQGGQVLVGGKITWSEHPNNIHGNRTAGLVIDGGEAHIEGDNFFNNGTGILITNEGTATVTGNNITGNATAGVLVNNGTAVVENNADISANGIGVQVINGGSATITDNTVTGNTGTGILVDDSSNAEITGNTATDNGGSGIALESPEGVVISNNATDGNAILGVDVGSEGRDANDAGDADSTQNFPVITLAEVDESGDLIVEYFVDSDPGNSEYPLNVEFFTSGSGSAPVILGQAVFSAGDFANKAATATLSGAASLGLGSGDSIAAIAVAGDGNTSETSDVFAVTGFVAPDAPPAPDATAVPAPTAAPPRPDSTTSAVPPSSQPEPTSAPATATSPASDSGESSGGSCSLPSRDGNARNYVGPYMILGLLGLLVFRRKRGN